MLEVGAVASCSLFLSLLFLFMRYSGMLFTAYAICVDSKHKGRGADGPL